MDEMERLASEGRRAGGARGRSASRARYSPPSPQQRGSKMTATPETDSAPCLVPTHPPPAGGPQDRL